jgi:hypothetical protein
VRVAVLLATVPVEQAAAHNRLQSNIKLKTFLAPFMPDAPSSFYLKFNIFSALLKVSRGEERHDLATPMDGEKLWDQKFRYEADIEGFWAGDKCRRRADNRGV